MTPSNTRGGLASVILVLALTPAGQAQRANVDAAALQDFNTRVEAFVQIRQRAEADAPPLPDDSSPEQIDAHQRSVAGRVQQERALAAQGDVLAPDAQVLIRQIVARQIEGPKGAEIRASILDEHPAGVVVRVNERYPDEVPLATMPPELLRELPKLPKGLEYRFVGTSLVIVDASTYLIVDFVPNALPE
jgi:hypothetical protein